MGKYFIRLNYVEFPFLAKIQFYFILQFMVKKTVSFGWPTKTFLSTSTALTFAKFIKSLGMR